MQILGRTRLEGAGSCTRGSRPPKNHKQSPTAIVAPLKLLMGFFNTIYVARGVQKEEARFGCFHLDILGRGLFEADPAPAVVVSFLCN